MQEFETADIVTGDRAIVKVKRKRRTRSEIFHEDGNYGPAKTCDNCAQHIFVIGKDKCRYVGFDNSSATDVDPLFVCKFWKPIEV